MNDEKEPRTGATPDDAELQASAVKVLGAIATAVNDPEIVAHINFGHGESYARGYNEGYDAGFHDGFGDTLPPGMVIAAASDVLTPELREAMVTVAKAVKRLHWDGEKVTREEWDACYPVLNSAGEETSVPS